MQKRKRCDWSICDGSGILMVCKIKDVGEGKVTDIFDGKSMLCRCHRSAPDKKGSSHRKRVTGYDLESVNTNLHINGEMLNPFFEEWLIFERSKHSRTEDYPNPLFFMASEKRDDELEVNFSALKEEIQKARERVMESRIFTKKSARILNF